MNGVFASLDYLLFFLFWQLQTIPMFLLIARFGGPRRLAAAWKFLAIDLAGIGLLLLAILILYFKAPSRTFDMVTLHDAVLPVALATLIAWLFFIAFAVRLPVFPFHTWFIDAQAEAPAPVAMILAGLLLKLGGYGIIRVDVGEFQEAFHRFVGAVVVIAVVTVLWSAVAALARELSDGSGRWKVSLRSSDGEVDVSMIARAAGGGGHKAAAGFTTEMSGPTLAEFLQQQVTAQL